MVHSHLIQISGTDTMFTNRCYLQFSCYSVSLLQ